MYTVHLRLWDVWDGRWREGRIWIEGKKDEWGMWMDGWMDGSADREGDIGRKAPWCRG